MSSVLAATAVRCAANAVANAKPAMNGNEDDLAYLQEKPSVGSRKGGPKGRRNTYIKRLVKQSENQAIVEKVLTNDKELSKKRRDRLISQLNNDLSVDVGYSLNRKNRWETISSAADFVKNADEPEAVTVSGVDSHYGVGLGKVSAYHQLMEGGSVNSKKCSKPMNGVALESLLANDKGKKRSKRLALAKIAVPAEDEAESKPHVRYILRKPHPIPQIFGGNLFKKPSGHLYKSSCRVRKLDSDYLDDMEMTASVTEEAGEGEFDMTASVAALYKAPRQSTFSLADFIKDSSPPVMIHAKSIESLADSSNEKLDLEPEKTATTSTAASLGGLPKLSKKTLFHEVEIPKAQMGISDFSEAMNSLALRQELKFRWLNSDETRCVLDLTHLLDEHTFKISMVVVIEALKSKEGYLRVLLNGSFTGPDSIADFVKDTTFKSPVDFVDKLVKKVQKSYNDERVSSKNGSLASYNSIYHGHQMATSVDPCGDYKIIEDAAARAPTVEAIIIDIPAEDDDAMEDFDEFELIEMDDIISEVDEEEDNDKDVAPEEPEMIPSYDTGCDMCPEVCEDELITLDSCGHRFCRSCIRTDLSDAILRRSAYPLMCLHDSCGTPISLDFLVTILPLPLAEYYFRFAFMAENVADGKHVIQCPHCRGSAAIDTKPTFGSVKCNKCSISFCARCERQPHFPLTCQQMDVWEKKFEKQYPVDIQRQSQEKTYKCECGEMVQNAKGLRQVTCQGCQTSFSWKTGEPTTKGSKKSTKPLTPINLETLPNNIAGEFSEICSLARVQRYDLTANRQITKMMCKSVDFRLKQAFIEIRKTALHLLEYGFAWLYLSRGSKPSSWGSIKAQLTLLRTKLDALHSLIANGQTDGIEAKVTELNTLTQKCLDDFIVA